MPALSTDLTGPRHPERCQSCGGAQELRRWLEHDEQDRPTPVVVVLCRACADRLIEPHPRLYRGLHVWEPHPGSLPLCVDCRHRDGTRCQLARLNGGAGVSLRFPRPDMIHVQRSVNGRRQCGHQVAYRGPVSACDKREADDPQAWCGWIRTAHTPRWVLACTHCTQDKCLAELLDHHPADGSPIVDRAVCPRGTDPNVSTKR